MTKDGHAATLEAELLERLLSIFDWVASHQRGEWTRGGPFVNASIELGEREDDAA
jgi:hypothetical protein